MLCAIWYHLHNLPSSRFLNCTNGIELGKASQIFVTHGQN